MNQEVVIIGGGVIGLSIARELHKRGAAKITIVEKGTLGSEASWAAAGMLAPNIETDATEDFHRFGLESISRYPAFAAALLDETGIDIELDRTGTLCVAFDANEAAKLEETGRRQKERGVDVESLSVDRLRAIESGISTQAIAALRYPNDWQVENRKLVSALRKYCESVGIRVLENTEVSELISDGGRITGARTVAETIAADVTVLATGAWTSFIKIGDRSIDVPVKPIRGQMMSFDTSRSPLRHVVYSERGYIVPRADGRVLVGATVEDVGFDKTITTEGIESLRAAAVEIAPELDRFPIADRWAGLRPFAGDGLPILGRLPGHEDVLIATAHYRNGILLAPRTAEIIADAIVDGRDSEFMRLYGVDRFSETASATFSN